MQGRTVPRLLKPFRLTKLHALLLLGGAFVFMCLAWTFSRYEIAVDRTDSAPEGAVFAATLLDRTREEWRAFEAALPPEARQALSVADGLETVTLFAVPHGKELQWWTVEAMSAVTERTGRTSRRLVPRGTDAVGKLNVEGRSIPFTANVSEGKVQARVGYGFRGLDFKPNRFTDTRRLLAPLHLQDAYAEKPAGASWGESPILLKAEMQRFQALAGLWNLPGRVEMAVSASETPGLDPFVLYHRPRHGSDLNGQELEAAAKLLLAESEPIGFQVSLPDDTSMTELRRDPDSIRMTRKEVRQFGRRAQLKSPEGSQQVEIFYDLSGEAWMSNDLNLIQAAFLGNMNLDQPTDSCEQGGSDGFFAFSGNNPGLSPLFQGFKRVTFSLESLETGLFTTCGYFGP